MIDKNTAKSVQKDITILIKVALLAIHHHARAAQLDVLSVFLQQFAKAAPAAIILKLINALHAQLTVSNVLDRKIARNAKRDIILLIMLVGIVQETHIIMLRAKFATLSQRDARII